MAGDATPNQRLTQRGRSPLLRNPNQNRTEIAGIAERLALAHCDYFTIRCAQRRANDRVDITRSSDKRKKIFPKTAHCPEEWPLDHSRGCTNSDESLHVATHQFMSNNVDLVWWRQHLVENGSTTSPHPLLRLRVYDRHANQRI
jgi:hypothetical protein